jgi:hypothetical protein
MLLGFFHRIETESPTTHSIDETLWRFASRMELGIVVNQKYSRTQQNKSFGQIKIDERY